MNDLTKTFGTLYHPKSALVFYQTENQNHDMYVEYFEMNENGNPINAHPLTTREAQRLAKMLNVQSKNEKAFLKPKSLISPNILFINPSETGKVIWCTQAQEKELFFVKNLDIPNGKVNVPALVWCADKQNLKIFALENDERPDENTPLFYAPFFNVYENGNVCMGNVDVKIKNSSSLEEFTRSWEDYFFHSYFSHLIGGHNPIKGNIINLWKTLIETENPFLNEVLMRSKLTLKNLIK
jgi:PRTRC genetic system protein B